MNLTDKEIVDAIVGHKLRVEFSDYIVHVVGPKGSEVRYYAEPKAHKDEVEIWTKRGALENCVWCIVRDLK